MPALPPLPRRLSALDGLRGVAALIVVVHHVSLLYPPIAATYMGGQTPHPGSISWWLTYSPLKLLTAGPEAVIVFFVLSGFVLTLPLLNGRPFDWMSYYPRRLVRIGLPVVCSILLAAALALLVTQNPEHARSSWVAATSVYPVWIERFVANLDPMAGDFALNNPLWSIYWEMAFSMMLPLFVGAAVLLRRWWPLLLALAVFAVFLGKDSRADGFHYLPAFFVGALAAVGLPRLRAVGTRISSWRVGWLVWLVALAASALLLISTWFVPAGHPMTSTTLVGLQPLAALGLIVCCLEWRPLGALLSLQPFQWAGRISFSLYLVHVPIIVALSYLLRGASLPVVAGLAIVSALGVAVLFYWLVERRSHGLSRWFGKLVSGTFASRYPGERPGSPAQPATRSSEAGAL
ncbi:acyltransferase [Leifsonia shinshuensis]|uniref:acyltransferase family protein n=1 Tax=Leifsonia shinshuensis TaxID=150026 RepID=UPI001F5149BD|nr:acyltransferase [Leifsonia shinshuensis]MCI0158190.1 acyltransferase [Leifsonia shinshuensis]